MTLNIRQLLEELASTRPVFHSEADFQHQFAWTIHTMFPEADVRLEYPVLVGQEWIHLDMWVENEDSKIAIELKYKTRKLEGVSNGMPYSLKNQGAQDIGRYDFLKDIWRLEQVTGQGDADVGYAILLTNDQIYWTPPRQNDTVDVAFRIHEGRTIAGELNWGDKASAGTKRGREQALGMRDSYTIVWNDYANLADAGRYGQFRFLLVRISNSLS